VCPICREPPVKAQSTTNSRHTRGTNNIRRPPHTNRNSSNRNNNPHRKGPGPPFHPRQSWYLLYSLFLLLWTFDIYIYIYIDICVCVKLFIMEFIRYESLHNIFFPQNNLNVLQNEVVIILFPFLYCINKVNL
jgi:hypothetical protein